jgi:hypothetical protein
MAEAKLIVTAETDEAQKALQGLRQEAQETSKEFKSLSSELGPGAGKAFGQLEGSVGGLAQAMGASSGQARVLTQSMKTITGAASGATMALGVAGVAVAALTAAVMASKRAHDDWQRSIIEGHQRVVQILEMSRSASRMLYETQVAGATEAEAAELRRQRVETIAREQALRGSRDREGALRQLDALYQGQQSIIQQLNAARRDGDRQAIAQLERRLALSRQASDDLRELIALIGEERREVERLKTAYEEVAEAAKLRNALAEQALRDLRRNNQAAKEAAELAERRSRAGNAAAEAARREREEAQRLLEIFREQEAAKASQFGLELKLAEEEAVRVASALEQAGKLKEGSVAEAEERAAREQEILEELKAKETEVATARLREIQRMLDERKAKEVQAMREMLAEQQKIEAQREALAKSAADRVAGALVSLGERGLKETLKSVGGSLQAEGAQRGLQGLALQILGNPQGAALMGVGAGMVAAGTAMRAAGGGGSGSPGSSGATPVAPGGSTQTNINETTTINNNVMIGDPREWNRDVRRADQQGQRLGIRGN